MTEPAPDPNHESTWEPTDVADAERLYDVAHARSGDKGDTLNVVVVPFETEAYPALVTRVTASRVADHFGPLVEGEVSRYPVPSVSCINFVFEGALDGGWTESLRLDAPGKTTSRLLLRLPLD